MIKLTDFSHFCYEPFKKLALANLLKSLFF